MPIKALEAAADRDEFEALKQRIAPDGAGTGSVFMDLYSSLARDYAEQPARPLPTTPASRSSSAGPARSTRRRSFRRR